MCDPISLTLGLVGAAVGITEAIVGGVQKQKQAQMMADMAAQQAAQYNQLARNAEEQGQWEKRNLALEQKAKRDSMLANAAGRGALIGQGSNLNIEMDLAQTADFDQKMKSYDIAQKKYQYQMQAYNSLMSKANYEMESSNAVSSMIMGATKGVFNGATTGIGVYGALGGGSGGAGGSTAPKGLDSGDLKYNFFG